ncbi:hypothetical protein [Pedobacter boryungensis]|uniref:Lipoprotein n=1 Tax=Pedobacter boryungensis TaxID=869962 RepID=A0ABX2DGB5_9SPHI|nr:hypothetical protein [Pedobacter boryungensis]NQX33151.1 hypothetical protein [Pedobacter boryungensis]
MCSTIKSICYFYLFFLFSSCSLNAPQIEKAAEIKSVIVAGEGKNALLIIHELTYKTVLHRANKLKLANSSSIFRYSVYQLNDGKLLNRLVTGSGPDDFQIIGVQGNTIWCYDNLHRLHTRNVPDLTILRTQKDMAMINPTLKLNASLPDVAEANQYYRYNPLDSQLTIINKSGSTFKLNLFTLRSVATEKSKPFTKRLKPTGNSVFLNPSQLLKLTGNSKQYITKDEKTDEEAYLFGRFLLEQDLNKLAIAEKSWEQKSTINDKRPAKIDFKTNFNEKMNRGRRTITGENLGGDSTKIYLLHSSSYGNSGAALISQVTINSGQYLKKWTLAFPDVFFNLVAKKTKSPFDKKYRAGMPSRDFEWYGIYENQFVGIKMAHLMVADLQSGKILYSKKL